MPYLIPDDWNGQDYALLMMCIPDSEQWRSSYTGAISYLNRGWQWDEKTGSILDTIQVARESFMSLSICGFDVVVAAINNVADAIRNQQVCCGATYGTEDNPPGTIDGTEGTPPAGFVEPVVAVDTHRCDMANLFYQGVDDTLTGLIDAGFESQFSLGVAVITLVFGTVLAGASAFFAAFVEYIGFVANLILSLFSGEFSLAAMQTAWQAAKEDIICTLYTEGDTDNRKAAYDDLVDTFGLSDAEAAFLKSFATLSTLAARYYAPETLAAQWEDLVGALDSTYQACTACVPAGDWIIAPAESIDTVFGWTDPEQAFAGSGVIVPGEDSVISSAPATISGNSAHGLVLISRDTYDWWLANGEPHDLPTAILNQACGAPDSPISLVGALPANVSTAWRKCATGTYQQSGSLFVPTPDTTLRLVRLHRSTAAGGAFSITINVSV